MKIYIDFDDVLCETAEYFTKIAKELFGIDVPYRQVQFFNLQKSFDLNDAQYEVCLLYTSRYTGASFYEKVRTFNQQYKTDYKE